MMSSTEDYSTQQSPPVAARASTTGGNTGRGAEGSTKSERRMKLCLLVWNLLIFIFACVLMAYGSYALSQNMKGAGEIQGSTLPAGIVVLGVFLFLLSFLGCLSTWKEKNIGLALYFIILFIMCVLLLGVGGAVLSKRNNADSFLSEGWKQANNDLRLDVQNYYGCCGLNYAGDLEGEKPDGQSACSTINRGGCLPFLVRTFKSKFYEAGSAALAFAIIMLFGLVVVILLMQRIKAKGDMLRYGPDSARRANNKNNQPVRGEGIEADLE